MEAASQSIPLVSLASSADVVKRRLLSSDRAGGFITGSELIVDGGYHAMTI